MQTQMLQWFLPTYHGDVKVEATGAKTCKVIVQEATREERIALAALEKHALSKKWVEPGTTFGPNTLVKAPVEKVALLLAKALKPTKKIVSAVKFSNGKIEEVTEQTFKVAAASSPTSAGSFTSSEPEKATSVVQPVRGCPPPDFSPARLRAWNVLNAFLTPEQQEDLAKYNRFVTTGGTTGQRYMITSRTARDELQKYQRSLFSLDEKRAYCVHDWDVPPEEEMHALNILIQLPGYEAYLRHLE